MSSSRKSSYRCNRLLSSEAERMNREMLYCCGCCGDFDGFTWTTKTKSCRLSVGSTYVSFSTWESVDLLESTWKALIGPENWEQRTCIFFIPFSWWLHYFRKYTSLVLNLSSKTKQTWRWILKPRRHGRQEDPLLVTLLLLEEVTDPHHLQLYQEKLKLPHRTTAIPQEEKITMAETTTISATILQSNWQNRPLWLPILFPILPDKFSWFPSINCIKHESCPIWWNMSIAPMKRQFPTIPDAIVQCPIPWDFLVGRCPSCRWIRILPFDKKHGNERRRTFPWAFKDWKVPDEKTII